MWPLRPTLSSEPTQVCPTATCIIKNGLEVTDKIVLEGGRHLRDGDKVEYVFRKPEASTGCPKIEREK
jgi:hypothetical protein